MKKEMHMEIFSRRSRSLSDSRFNDTINSETRSPLETSEHLSCPFNEHQCYKYCLSKGYRGGYCGGLAFAICRCY